MLILLAGDNMATHRKGKLEKMNIIFSQSIKEMGVGKEFFSHMVLYYWPKIVGKHISANVKPVNIEFKKLFLYTSHPIWANQLSYMKDEIKNKINNFMGEYLVEDIVFTNNRPVNITEENNSPAVNIGYEINKINLSDKKIEEIKNDLNNVKNDDLKKVIFKVRLNDEKYKKYRLNNNWHKCKKCNNLCQPEDELCNECKRKANIERLASIRKFLMDMPWARYCDIEKEIPCNADEVNEERIILMQKLAAKINIKNIDCFEMSLLTMLYKSVPPEKVTDELKESTIKKFRYDFIDGYKYARKDNIKKYKKYKK